MSANACESSLSRHVWESKADGQFAISEDTWNEPLGRGTEIRLHLREEAGEYLEEAKLKVLHIFFHMITTSPSVLLPGIANLSLPREV